MLLRPVYVCRALGTLRCVSTRKHAVEPLLTPGEVAERFAVDVHTVRRWADKGKLTSVRTPGGTRRYLAVEVDALLRGETA